VAYDNGSEEIKPVMSTKPGSVHVGHTIEFVYSNFHSWHPKWAHTYFDFLRLRSWQPCRLYTS